MKYLTLIRHAKSGWTDPAVPDFQRPLNERGWRDAPRMGRALAALKLSPDLIVTSPAVRAITTATLIAEALRLPEGSIRQDDRIYDAELLTLHTIVRELADSLEHVFLVGHNPGMQTLAAHLADDRLAQFVTCGVACLELDIKRWRDVVPHCGRLLRFLRPKELKG